MIEVTVLIDKKGKPIISVQGAKGKQCLTLTQDLEKQLGGQVETRVETTEATQSAGIANVQTQKLGG